MEGLPERLARFMELLETFPERSDRIQILIDVADRFREVDPEVAQRPFPAERQVPHCESEAYVWALPREDGTLDFQFAVENPQGISARAMAVILDETLSGVPPEQVARVPGDLPLALFGNELSMGKSMGLMGMVAMVISAARKRAAATASR